MKKLLVLMLVLGMASLANAALIVTADNVTWEVVGDQVIGTGTSGAVDMYLTTVGYGASNVVLSRNTDTTGTDGANIIAGNNGKVLESTGIYWRPQGGDIGLDEATWTQAPGVWYVFDIETTTETEIFIYDGGFAQLGGDTLTIPEPMSMVLLGIGGLFLRRRK